MKPLHVFCLLVFLNLSLRLQAQTDIPTSTADRLRSPAHSNLRFFIKERTLWKNRANTRYINANLTYNRSVSEIERIGISRASSYTLPVLYGHRLDERLSVEGGLFGGVNRCRQLGTGMIGELDQPSETDLAYGLLMGVSHHLYQGVDVKLRYRHDLNSTFETWNPIQAGLSFSF